MGLATFDIALSWVQAHGYPLIFLAMIIEGPVLTAAASFAAALGKLDLPIVMALSFAGDLVGDVVHYSLGYFGRERVLDRYGHKVGLSRERLEKLEAYLGAHAGKSLLLAKWIPALSTIILVAAGAIRMPVKKFATIVSLVILPRTILFVALGFYAGKAFGEINRVLQDTVSLLVIFAIGFVGLYFLYRALSKRIAAQLGSEQKEILP